ncbi:MAG: VOC family protein [Cytophagaceae bacterium]
MRIHSYLTFNGNCREAMQFYKSCLGGNLVFQTVGESPLGEKLPEKMRRKILHASLSQGEMVLMGTDLTDAGNIYKGNSVSLFLTCETEKEMKVLFKKLSSGGVPSCPPTINSMGSWIGTLTDRYGNHWLLSFQEH